MKISVIAVEKPDSSYLAQLNDILSIAEKDYGNGKLKIVAEKIAVNRENVDASYEEGSVNYFFYTKKYLF